MIASCSPILLAALPMIMGGGSKLVTAPGTYDSFELMGLPLGLVCYN